VSTLLMNKLGVVLFAAFVLLALFGTISEAKKKTEQGEGARDDYVKDDVFEEVESEAEEGSEAEEQDEGQEGDNKITGGTLITRGEQKALVYIVTSRDDGTYGFCTGVLLNWNWVLTANRCFLGVSDANVFKTYLIAGGVPNINTWESTEGQVRKVQYYSWKRLNTYSSSSPDSNRDSGLRLLKADTSFESGGDVSYMYQASGAPTLSSSTIFSVVGYGRTSSSSTSSSSILRIASVPYSLASTCGLSSSSTAELLCAGGGSKGVCIDDYGAPLYKTYYLPDGSKAYKYLHGIYTQRKGTSSSCGRSGYPAIYTRADKKSPYNSWIYSTMRDH